MMQRNRFRKRVGFIAAMAFALMALAPIAVGATEIGALPGALANGTSIVVLQGNGFGPGEKVQITGYLNDGRTAIYPILTADAGGAFNVPENIVAGVTRYVGIGQNTGLSASTIVGVPNFPPGSLPGVLPPIYSPYSPYYGGYGGYGYGGYGNGYGGYGGFGGYGNPGIAVYP